MKRYLPYLFLLFTIFSACKKETKAPKPSPPVTPGESDISFSFVKGNNSGKLDEDVACQVSEGKINALLPSFNDDRSALVASFTVPTGATVKVAGVVQKSAVTVHDFRNPITYTVTKADGTSKDYTFTVLKYAGLPIFYLTTSAPVVSKDDYVTGNLVVDANSQFPQDVTSIDLQIKGRGNSTWDMPKKPYRLKFNTKTAMLGFTAAKNWVLLANYADKTLMRNGIAFEMGKDFGSNFVPTGRYVDVVMNGNYIGNYYMTEQVEVNPGRIDIEDIKTTDISGDALTGGYVLELDQHVDEDHYFYTAYGLPMGINSPDDITPEQLAYIKDYIQKTENSIFSANFADPTEGYAKYIDVDSFISWYLVKELVKDNDGKDYSSIYYYKDKNGKLGMGPLWDFDLSIGNTDYSDCKNPTGWWIKDSKWFTRLFQDPAFVNKVKTKWKDFKANKLPGIYTYMDQTENYVSVSANYNFTRWDILNIYVWPNPVVTGSYDGEVAYTRKWLSDRVNWMDTQLQ